MQSANFRNLREMSLDDLELVLTWRNHPSLRRNMYTQHEISIKEHRQWFEDVSKDPKRHLLIFESESVQLGFVNVKEYSARGVAEWGFYTAPDAPIGTGRQLGSAVLEFVFLKMKCHRLYGQVLRFNERSIHFHKILGFKQEGILRQHHFDGEEYHDIVCFGLLCNEWRGDTKE